MCVCVHWRRLWCTHAGHKETRPSTTTTSARWISVPGQSRPGRRRRSVSEVRACSPAEAQRFFFSPRHLAPRSGSSTSWEPMSPRRPGRCGTYYTPPRQTCVARGSDDDVSRTYPVIRRATRAYNNRVILFLYISPPTTIIVHPVPSVYHYIVGYCIVL